MARKKYVLSHAEILSAFLSKETDKTSNSLQIDSNLCLYYSGEMIAAWRDKLLFIDCGSNRIYTRKQIHSLRVLAEEKGIVYVPYNEYSLAPTREFLWVERLVSYGICSTPLDVNPKIIFAQSKKVLDKGIEKGLSFDHIQKLINSCSFIASLFDFEFDSSEYEKKEQQQKQLQIAKKTVDAQYHLDQYNRLRKEIDELLCN